ncbi:MAG: hypothetical protein K2X46_18890 [Roseomonas sp.]|nr:hypothetical protein [Roseomonas sp.]
MALDVSAQVEREAVLAGQAYADRSAAIAQTVAADAERQLSALKALAVHWLANQSDNQFLYRAELARSMVAQNRRPGSFVAHYAIYDLAGRVLWQSGGEPPMQAAGTETALPPLRGLRDPTAELQLELISSGASGEQAEAYASIAVVLESGMVGGVAVAMLRPSLLSSALTAMQDADGNVLALALETGQVLARSQPGPVRIDPFLAGGPINAASRSVDRGHIRTASIVAGRDQILAWRRLENLPMFAIGTVDAERQLASASHFRWTAYLAAGCATVLALLALVVWLRRQGAEDARSAVAARRAVHAELERLIGGIPALLFLKQVLPEGGSRLVYRGGDLEAVTGWPPSTFDGHDSLLGWTDIDTAERDAFVARVIAEGVASHAHRFRQPDGSFRHMRLHCRRLPRAEAGVTEIVGFMLDVTSQVHAEARAQVAAKLASLGAISAGLAHELKQPLTAISLAAEVAQLQAEQIGASAIIDRLAQIVEEVDRTVHMIESLRRFARGSGAEFQIRSVPLAAVIECAVSLVARHLRALSVTIEVDAGTPGQEVLGEPEAIKRILVNLLTNAGDATGALQSGVDRRIKISVRKDAARGMIAVSVADNGGGIDSHVLPRLFEPFVTTKPAEIGTGLGLSISLDLAEAMMGKIEARNEHGGAVFTLLLTAPPGGTAHQEIASTVEAGVSNSVVADGISATARMVHPAC